MDRSAPESTTASTWSPSSSGTGSMVSALMSIRSARPRSPNREASWSSRPVSAPHQSRSIREQSRASSTRPGGSAPATAHSARQSDTDSAADDDRPAPRGARPGGAPPPPGAPPLQPKRHQPPGVYAFAPAVWGGGGGGGGGGRAA